jgi:Ser/Thr protein kinase RdoA (MazF antagonist)
VTLLDGLEAGDAQEIADRYALGRAGGLTGPAARGEQGEVWHLVTDRGRWAVKRPFDPGDVAEAERATRFQEAAGSAGVPAPAVVRTRSGDVFARIGGATIRVYGWVDLAPSDPAIDPVAVGEVVAAIHRVTHDAGLPTHPWYSEPVGAAQWDDLVDRLVRAGAPFADRFAEYRRELVALERLLEAPSRLQTCHRDLWADNVLATLDGSLCVIDWDNCGRADPSHELAMVLFEFGMGEPDRIGAVYRAYLAAGGVGRVDGTGDFSMVIATLGHIGRRHAELWLDPGADRARAVAGVEEFLGDRRLTIEGVTTILDTVAGR